jgi:hypothetical protein
MRTLVLLAPLVLAGCAGGAPTVLRLACPLARAAVEAGCSGVPRIAGEEPESDGSVDLPLEEDR